MRLYGQISKVEPQDDGTVKVEGIASSEAVDDQGEIVSASAMRSAIPGYMVFPALREMHQLSAAGTTLEAEVGDDGATRIFAHVVDPVAVTKVKNLVYRGFSIGGQVTERDTTNRKIITGIKLNEISLVDRPANPEAKLDCWKASAINIEGTDDMKPLATLGETPAGEKLAAVAAMLEPIQVWACGIADHQHAAKGEAVKCLEAQNAEKAAKASDSAELVLEESAAVDKSAEISDSVAEGAKQPEAVDAGEHDPAAAGPGDAQTTLEAAREAMERAKAALGEPAADDASKGADADAVEAPEDTDTVTKTPRFAKSLFDIGRVAEIIMNLDWLCEDLGFEALLEGDNSPQPGRLKAIVGELCGFLNAFVAEETAEIVAGDDDDDGGMNMDQVAMSAIITSLQKTITDPEQLEALVSSVIEKGARHGAMDQVHLDNAAYATLKALATKSATRAEKMDIGDAHKVVLDAGATSIAAPASRSAPRNATQDTGRNAQTQAPQSSAGAVPASPMPKASDQELLEDAINKFGSSIATLEKAGGRPSVIVEILSAAEDMKKAGAAPHHVLMDMTHKSLRAFSDGSTCKEDVADPSRHTDMDMSRVHKAHFHIGRVGGGKCGVANEASGTRPDASESEGEGASSSAKAITGDDLAKALTEKTAENALLTKTLAEIVPLMTSMNKRIEQIAETPIAPRAMARMPSASLTKAADNGGADGAQLTDADLVTELAGKSPQEQTLLMIKASYRKPITGQIRSLSTAAEQRENFPAR